MNRHEPNDVCKFESCSNDFVPKCWRFRINKWQILRTLVTPIRNGRTGHASCNAIAVSDYQLVQLHARQGRFRHKSGAIPWFVLLFRHHCRVQDDLWRSPFAHFARFVFVLTGLMFA